MSEEEKKAVEDFKEDNVNDLSRFDDFNSYTQFKVKRDEILLNLIQKQEGKIKLLKDQLQYVIDEYGETIEKQEKIIDKMAEYFEGYEMNDVITFENKEQVKEYFEEEVEKEC